MDITLLSNTYQVRKINKEDLAEVLNLCLSNPMFYEYCPPFPTLATIEEDMLKLPPNKTMDDKHYIGFYFRKELIAVMDLILSYPNSTEAFIGFFMVKKEVQRKGIGSLIIREAFNYLGTIFKSIRLGYVLGNPQSEAFWIRQGFAKTGILIKEDLYSIVVLKKEIGGVVSGN